MKRIINNDGDTVGVVNPNTLLDTRNYEVQYLEFLVEDMSANQIA